MALTHDSILLSIVLPAYNEQARIKRCLTDLKSFFDKLGNTFEVLLVVEKSGDETYNIAQSTIANDPRFKIIQNDEHKGKGFAVKTGMLQAHGAYVMYMDVDLSTPLVEVFNFLSEMQSNIELDVLIGDRKHSGSKIIKKQNYFRQKAGEFFNLLVQLLVFKGLRDTQCGFKMFKAHTVKHLFENLVTNGFAFDVEVLLKAKKKNFKIKSMPVQWINSSHSKVSFIKDGIKMFFEIIKIKFLITLD